MQIKTKSLWERKLAWVIVLSEETCRRKSSPKFRKSSQVGQPVQRSELHEKDPQERYTRTRNPMAASTGETQVRGCLLNQAVAIYLQLREFLPCLARRPIEHLCFAFRSTQESEGLEDLPRSLTTCVWSVSGDTWLRVSPEGDTPQVHLKQLLQSQSLSPSTWQ